MENILNALKMIFELGSRVSGNNLISPIPKDGITQQYYTKDQQGNYYINYPGGTTQQIQRNQVPSRELFTLDFQPSIPTSSEKSSIEQLARQTTMDYSPYIADQQKIDTHFPQGLPQPTLEQKMLMLTVSPDDATRSAILKLGETGMNKYNGTGPFNYAGDNPWNNNKTIDRGQNQINSGTFNWMWNQQGNKRGTYPYRGTMQKYGISSFEDMKDPMKNERMMDLIRGVQGYGKSDKSGGGWYGWADKGFDLNKPQAQR